MLRIDINLIFTVINILVLFGGLWFVLFKPVRKILDERQAEANREYDEAKQKQLVLHGKSVYTAAQAAASQAYATNMVPSSSGKTNFVKKVSEISDADEFGAKIVKAHIYFKSGSGKHDPYTVQAIDYLEGEDWVCLKDGTWESGSGAKDGNGVDQSSVVKIDLISKTAE